MINPKKGYDYECYEVTIKKIKTCYVDNKIFGCLWMNL